MQCESSHHSNNLIQNSIETSAALIVELGARLEMFDQVCDEIYSFLVCLSQISTSLLTSNRSTTETY